MPTHYRYWTYDRTVLTYSVNFFGRLYDFSVDPSYPYPGFASFGGSWSMAPGITGMRGWGNDGEFLLGLAQADGTASIEMFDRLGIINESMFTVSGPDLWTSFNCSKNLLAVAPNGKFAIAFSGGDSNLGDVTAVEQFDSQGNSALTLIPAREFGTPSVIVGCADTNF
jgi:hypothetical protein